MALARRIIPTVLVNGRALVKGRQFNSWRSVGLAVQAARIHATRSVDELCILDVGATAESRGPDLGLVEELSELLFTPLSVGGGIRTCEDVRQLLRHGADKVVVGTGGPRLVAEIAEKFGSSTVVASVDAKDGHAWVRCGSHKTEQPVVGWATSCATHGAGEILLQSIDRDGTMQGYDLPLIREVSQAVSIPVIASGGAGSYQDMLAAFEAGADAVAVGAAFQFRDLTPKGAAQFLQKNGVVVRI